MRVYPPVPFNARTANKDTYLPVGGGPDGQSSVLVKKGQRVVFSSWGSHRSFDYFGDDAYDFRPERWESVSAQTLAGYIPFNLGPRACPGREFAVPVFPSLALPSFLLSHKLAGKLILVRRVPKSTTP